MQIHRCVRVYANGEAKETTRDCEGLTSWLAYNRTFRPGNALFVDGHCDEGDRGYLDSEEIDGIAATLAKEFASAAVPSPARLSAGRYPDDRARRGFKLRSSPDREARGKPATDRSRHAPDEAPPAAGPKT